MDIFTPRTYCGQSSNILYEGIQLISHLQNSAISNNWNMQSIRKIFVTSLMNISVEYKHGMFVINIQFKYTRQIFVWNIQHLNAACHRVLNGKYSAKIYITLTLIITNTTRHCTSLCNRIELCRWYVDTGFASMHEAFDL